MSRIPAPNRTPRTPNSPLKPSASRTRTISTLTPTTPSSARTRTTSTLGRATTPTKKLRNEPEPSEAKPALSIKEVIALKRAEAKKAAQQSKGGLGDIATLEDALPASGHQAEEDTDFLGRLPLRETIEKARSTGSLNLSTRELPCLPSGLFEIHLNITPDPLKSVENEPKLPPAEERPPARKGARPAWFEAQDLVVLKAWNNEITEIQHEISLFGSLKVVDLHKNKLTALPSTFADLSFLTNLDLSENLLTSLPDSLWSLPELTTLNISNNQLTSLPFTAPFHSSSKRTGPNSYASTDFFTPAIVRAATPLPKLVVFEASHNNITADSIDLDIPSSLTKLDLSSNPLGNIAGLLKKLSTFSRLRELRFEKADVSISSDPFTSSSFPALRILDLSETSVSLSEVQKAFKPLTQELDHSFTIDEPPHGVARILVGKRVLKEAWEVELEKRSPARVQKGTGFGTADWEDPEPPAAKKTPEAKMGPVVKPASAAAATRAKSPTPAPKAHAPLGSRKEAAVKEAWEIEAEQGMLTEGGRRRARAAAAAAAAEKEQESASTGGSSSINSPQYYKAQTQTLTLPASAPPKVAAHSRSFSLASPFASSSSSPAGGRAQQDIAMPAPTLPLSLIVAQPFADTLKVLILANRRLDRTFTIPGLDAIPALGFLPQLEELDLEGCNLDDTVSIQRVPAGELGDALSSSQHRSTEPILSILAKLFPSLRTLNLSYNRLTDSALSFDALSALILQAPHKAGLRALRLRGNRLNEIEGLKEVAGLFKGNREVEGWKMEELDLRDNEIGKLHAELGMLPLDVFLVEGNTFRVPQRRVWEREGTKGLLSWLRGRIE